MSETKERSVSLPVAGDAGSGKDAVWYAEGLQFACTQCGGCCSGAPGYVWVTLEDMNKIAAFLKMSFEDFARTYVRQIGDKYSLTEKYNYDCAFLTRRNGKTGCMIYPVRPTQCRTWPFWNDNLKSENAWERAAEKCPGMKVTEGAKFGLEHIEKCRTHPESP
jgi:Fe-S-cluster containining protein